jgi:hypothetical protein
VAARNTPLDGTTADAGVVEQLTGRRDTSLVSPDGGCSHVDVCHPRRIARPTKHRGLTPAGLWTPDRAPAATPGIH